MRMRSKLWLLAGVAVSGAVALYGATQVWVTLLLADGAAAFDRLEVTGQQLNQSLSPIALAALAAALALTIAGPAFRRVLGVLVALLGAGVAAIASAALGDAHVLPVPLPSERRNTAGALEHLGATMSVTLRRRGVLVWEGRSDLAALEHGGLARAEAELRRRGIPASAGATHAAPRLP